MADNAQLTIKFNPDGIVIEGTATKPDIISAALLLLGTIEPKDASTFIDGYKAGILALDLLKKSEEKLKTQEENKDTKNG